MKGESKSLDFLYNNPLGLIILKVIYNPWFSVLMGSLLNTRISALKIDGFVKKHNIDMPRFKKVRYKSFNEFFIRELKDNTVVQDDEVFISPCDGNLLVHEIDDNSEFEIKNFTYNVNTLLGVDNDKYHGGLCLIFRLEATDYHRYCYIDNGVKGDNIFIRGKLHTVQDIAFDKFEVHHTNSREWTEMKTDNFGTIIQVEVGALVVGKIDNYHEEYSFKRGEEKGRFEFGGSTIIMLIEKDKIQINDEILAASKNDTETHVFFGTKIGVKL